MTRSNNRNAGVSDSVDASLAVPRHSAQHLSSLPQYGRRVGVYYQCDDPGTEATSPENLKEAQKLVYELEDVPAWYICILLGLQHYVQMIGSTVACVFFLAPPICMSDKDPDQANIISTLVLMSGIITLLQSTFGSRLPIVQGPSYTYLIPAIAIMQLPEWKCPNPEALEKLPVEERRELWQIRMRDIQGAIILASIFEVLFAITGLVGWLSNFVTPMTVAPMLILIGLALFQEATQEASSNYIVAISTLILLVILSQYLRNVQLRKFPVFQVFSVLLSVVLVWAVCGILTLSDVIPKEDPARADAKIEILHGSPWFRIPYPFQWGWPTLSLGTGLGMFLGMLTSTVESVGDYCACATICGKPTPPRHATNRGIFMEGFGGVLSGIWGSGNGSTSYSTNIGTISITRVASRRVIQVAGILMVFISLFGKVNAIFLTLPDPILAGMFLYLLPLIITVGMGTLVEVSMSSARNIFIVSFSTFFGLAISQWAIRNPDTIQTGTPSADSILQVFLTTGMFLGGLIGFILDNTVPGTKEERGISRRTAAARRARSAGDTTYDIPFGMNLLSPSKFCNWLPIFAKKEPTDASIELQCPLRS